MFALVGIYRSTHSLIFILDVDPAYPNHSFCGREMDGAKTDVDGVERAGTSHGKWWSSLF